MDGIILSVIGEDGIVVSAEKAGGEFSVLLSGDDCMSGEGAVVIGTDGVTRGLAVLLYFGVGRPVDD